MKTRQYSAAAELRLPSAKPLPTETRPLWMLTESELEERFKNWMIAALAEFKAGEQPGPDLLGGDQMALKIGISRSKLHKLRVEGAVPSVRVGTVYKYEPAAVMAALRGQGTR